MKVTILCFRINLKTNQWLADCMSDSGKTWLRPVSAKHENYFWHYSNLI